MTKFSISVGLDKTQSELDFVDVPIDTDIDLFIDPFALSQRSDPLSVAAHETLCDFFQSIVDAIRAGNTRAVTELVGFLQEPNETHLGLSRKHPRGAGIGSRQAKLLVEALSESTAVKTGFIKSLEECELMVEGIGHDKVSDLTTNVIRAQLGEYTRGQCELWSIPTQSVALPPAYSIDEQKWVSRYYDIPVVGGKPILLVPKVIVRRDPAMEHQGYYNRFVLDYLQAEHLDAGTSLVRTLRNGDRKVYKKDLKEEYPCTKKYLFDFSRQHPEVLSTYRKHLAAIEKRGDASPVDLGDEVVIAKALSKALKSIPPGNDDATKYHHLMIGILEFIFFPMLLNPIKEREIHEGRKRIDIVMENGARSGILHRLHSKRSIPCGHIVIECKNYGREIANPELDQIAGRFSRDRGKVGLLCCRGLRDCARFVRRCRDTFKDDRGLVVPIDDEFIQELLKCIANRERKNVEAILTNRVDEIAFS